MAKDDRPEDGPAPRKARRRRPPVLELKATEVGASADKASAEKSKAERDGKAKVASPGTGPWNEWRERVAAFRYLPLATGAAGVIAGALVVALVMRPAGERADPRVGELAGEVAALSGKIEALAARPVPAPAPAADNRGLIERIDKLTAAIGAAEQRLAAVEQRPEPQAPDLSAVNERAAAIDGTLQELRAALGELHRMTAASPGAVEKLAARIGGLDDRIAALAAAARTPPPAPAAPSSAPLAAQMIALNELADALRAGRPFAAELDAARARLGARAALFVPLEPYARAGLPTVAALAERFSALAPELLRAPDTGGGLLARFRNSVARLVEVRPVGEPEGSSPGAIVARAETKLGRGDLAGALREFETLPDPVRAKASDWFDEARTRLEADQVLRRLADDTLSQHAERREP